MDRQPEQPNFSIPTEAASAAMDFMCGFRSLGAAGNVEVSAPYSPEMRAHLQAVIGRLPSSGNQRGTEPVQNVADYLRALADTLAPRVEAATPISTEAADQVDEPAPEPAPPLSPVEAANYLLTLANGRYIRPDRWEGMTRMLDTPRLVTSVKVEIHARGDDSPVPGASVSVSASSADFRSVFIASGFDFASVIQEAQEKLAALPTNPEVEESVTEAAPAPALQPLPQPVAEGEAA